MVYLLRLILLLQDMEMCQKYDTTDEVVDSHTIEVFASEGSRYPIQDQVEIPRGYDVSEVVVLPVNKDTVFVYWEITGDFLRQWLGQVNQTQPGISGANLILVAFELSPGQARHIDTFDISTLSGKRYMHCQGRFNPTVAIIGAFKGDTFYDMLVSRTIYYPAYRLEGVSIDFIADFCLRRTRLTTKSPGSQKSDSWEYTFSGSNVEKPY
ncbi:hypothetical protein MBAV_003792 [Candidatus Magnetobacterium bavaricum]|uniref:DUF4912 domain-containing protein n=1 Tax=Candidatus Magnetobacterium bavaricum TaxID=29290 RepID=A0A0F3GQC0_9BACT|nr:hypothetical protein MBAV_003792 [Candidatus Magnetobacterium bavaricum]